MYVCLCRFRAEFGRSSIYTYRIIFLFPEMRPPARKGQPVIVEFSIYVVDVNSINVEDMDFR